MFSKYFTDLMKYKLGALLQRPEMVFLIVAAFFGVVMVFLMPPLMVPDELAHFDRSYQVAQGKVTSQTVDGKTGGMVPQINVRISDVHHVPLVFDAQYFIRISKNNDVFTAFPNSAVYSPISYLPQALGIRIAQFIYPSIGLMFIMGRLLNLAAFIVLIFAAIKIARQGKWVYAVVGLFPMAIQQAASLSSDVMTISFAFLTIATIHRLFLQTVIISKKQILFVLFLAFGLGLTKQTNIILILPILFLPLRLFVSWRHKAWFVSAVCLVGVGALVAWYLVGKFLNYDMNFSPYDVNQLGQLKQIMAHPLSFLVTLLKTYVYEGVHGGGVFMADFFLVSLVGFFSWISYKLPLIFIISEYVLLFVALIYRDQKGERRSHLLGFSVLQIATLLLSMFAIAFVLYLTWTKVGATQVDGIQGRYFIPLIPLLIAPFVLAGRYVKLQFDKSYRMGMLVGLVSIVNLSMMVFLTYDWFYK